MKKIIGILLIFFLIFSGCSDKDEPTNNEELNVFSPHPIEFIDPIITEFENETEIKVNVTVAGTGELLNRIETAKNNPNCDVIWGGSISILENSIDLYDKYYSNNEDHVIYKNNDGYITRFTLMPSVIMVNENLIGKIEVKGYEDLLNPQLKGKIAFANPRLSSSSYEQLLNQLEAMKNNDGSKSWKYIEALSKNIDNKLLDNSSDVYNGVLNGEFIVGLTFEEAAANFVNSGAPVKIVYPEEGTIFRPDGIAKIKNAKNSDNADRFIDFLTSKEIQEYISVELNRRPIRKDVLQPNNLVDYDNIIKINDDQSWASSNKNEIVEEFLSIYNKIGNRND